MATYRYGVDADLDELRQIQRIERPYGVRRLHNWLGEGMPYEAMGNPHTMDRFRERKGTPVPWNSEAKNEESVYRSQRAIQRGPRSGEADVPDAVRDVISSPGQSLDPSIQRAMEERMGDSFGVLASEAREGSKGERSESFGDVRASGSAGPSGV